MDIQKILDRHKQTVAALLQSYDLKEPLHLYLKKYFAAHKKHGSKDRKYITRLLYSYFRMGENARVLDLPLSELLDISCFVTDNLVFPAFIAERFPEQGAGWQVALHRPEERFSLIKSLYPAIQQELLFPFKAVLSQGLARSEVEQRLLHQVDVFIRIREQTGVQPSGITGKLAKAGIAYETHSSTCISVAAGTPVQQFLDINREVVIQDSSSQQMAAFMQLALLEISKQKAGEGRAFSPVKIWDACAASGGKSILVNDLAMGLKLPIKLMVTDIRAGILNNLERRFHEAAVMGYHKQVVDLLAPGALAFQGDFDLILCDAPCSGSGTWAHNPENIQSFKEADLEEYYQKQTGIARKAWSRLRRGGYFLYMTCSVFERENEQVSQFIADNSGMELIMQKVVTGAAKNQVSMFAALYTRKK